MLSNSKSKNKLGRITGGGQFRAATLLVLLFAQRNLIVTPILKTTVPILAALLISTWTVTRVASAQDHERNDR
jgi:hypothetical protein